MIKEIAFGNNQITFKSSGATPILYKQTFKEDLIVLQKELAKKRDELQKIKNKDTDEYYSSAFDVKEVTETMIQQLAFIMWVEGNFKGEELFKQLTQVKYIEFLMMFDINDLLIKGADILAIYNNNSKTLSKPKNE